jgi:hypothetical protein
LANRKTTNNVSSKKHNAMDVKKYQLEPTPRQIEGICAHDDIFLLIEIGNGQEAGNKVSYNNVQLAKGDLTKKTNIGKAVNLLEHEIVIDTNVIDVNSQTNTCVITTSFFNQDNKQFFTKVDKGDAPENGIANFHGKYMLKLLSIFILISWAFTGSSYAQNSTDNIAFKNLETPSSPGFILLDQAPSSIEKPTTPQGFGISVLSFFQGKGGAIEFAPFWLSTHPKLTAGKMFATKFPILYNFSVSGATIKSDSINYIAGGFRTRLFQSYSDEQANKLASVKENIVDELSKDPDSLNLEKIESLRQEYVNITQKPTFTIDVAAAFGGGSPTNSFNDVNLNRRAAWLSFNWRPKGDKFYFTALTRYINYEKSKKNTVSADLVDLGTRLNYDISKFCLSMEYLQRLNFTSKKYDDFRIAIIGSYKLSDNFFITSTFGKNFTDVNNIIALAGINFGFSRNKVNAF